MFINGERRTTDNKLKVHNPATGEEVFEIDSGHR